jgi:hypothetical protein
MQELYDATGNDANTIISHKSTIPDLVIWNKTFDKNECFEGAECNNNNPFPRFQFYLRVKTNKTNEKTEKKKKDKKVNTKDELSRKESNQDIPTVSLLSTTTTTTENGKANKDIKDKRKDNKNKMNNTNKKTENKNDKTNKLGDNTNNTVNNSNTNKIKPPRTLKDLLDGENTNKPNVTTVDTKQIFNDNNNNNINNNSINSNSLSNSPFDDIEQDNKMFGQVLTNKNELNTNTNLNINVQQSSKEFLSNFFNIIYSKYNIHSMKQLFLNYIIPRLPSLNNKYIELIIKHIETYPSILDRSIILSINQSVSYITFILCEIYTYLSLKTVDGVFYYKLRAKYEENILLNEKMSILSSHLSSML